MQEELLAYVEEESHYQQKLSTLRQFTNYRNLSEDQLNECLDSILYLFETEALFVNVNNTVVYTDKYEEFKKNYTEKNYLSGLVDNLKTKTKTETVVSSPNKKKSENITINEFITTIFNKPLKDFIKEAEIKTYAERINYKTNKIDKTMLIRAARSTESYFTKILYEYFVHEAEKDIDKFNIFYNNLVEATKQYYSSVEYCVTIGNFFSDKEDLWFTIYQDYLNKKLNNSDSMGAKYEWD